MKSPSLFPNIRKYTKPISLKFENSISENTLKSNKYGLSIILLVSLAFQLIPLFFGFDFCDTGFYLTFYSNFFSNPESIEYNYMYYLTGLIGGCWNCMFGWMGLFGFRILGIIFNSICISLVYLIFRNTIPYNLILISCLLIICGFLQAPLAFNNDILSETLIIIGIYLLYNGLNELNRKSFFLVFLSGLVFGINAFARIPNILDILFVLLIFIFPNKPILNNTKKFKFSVYFTSGWLIGILAILSIIYLLGHTQYFINNILTLINIADAKSSDELTTHSLTNLVLTQFNSLILIFRMSIKILLVFILLYSTKFFKNKLIKILPFIFVLSFTIYILLRSNTVIVLAGIALFGLLGLLIINNSKLRFLSWCAIFATIILPLGSDGGINNIGTIDLWIALPPALLFITTLWKVLNKEKSNFTLYTPQLYFIGVGIIFFFNEVSSGVYFDNKPIWVMTSKINNQKMNNIFTSNERASIVNETLDSLKNYIKPNDALFAFGSVPMIHYLSETKPATGCSWPELLSVSLLKKNLSIVERNHYPILIQKFPTIGGDYDYDTNEYLYGSEIHSNKFHNIIKSNMIYEFIKTKNYSKAFETNYFVLYK